MPLVPDIGPQHGRPQLGISQADSSETHCSIYLGQLDELFQQMLHQAPLARTGLTAWRLMFCWVAKDGELKVRNLRVSVLR